MKFPIMLFLSTVFVISAFAQPNDRKAVSDFFQDKTKIENPFELRDPFKAPPIKHEGNAKTENGFLRGKDKYSNINQADLSTVSLDKIKVVGVLIGKERRALVKLDTDKAVINIKEGDKIGPDKAELKAILPGGIILVERITNVYGQEEYLETVIPISR